jgi:hypothetical protein
MYTAVSFPTISFHQQYININVIRVCKITRNEFRKCFYSKLEYILPFCLKKQLAMLISAIKAKEYCVYEPRINSTCRRGSLQLKPVSKSFNYMALII